MSIVNALIPLVVPSSLETLVISYFHDTVLLGHGSLASNYKKLVQCNVKRQL